MRKKKKRERERRGRSRTIDFGMGVSRRCILASSLSMDKSSEATRGEKRGVKVVNHLGDNDSEREHVRRRGDR